MLSQQDVIPSGLCQCGCRQKTTIATSTNTRTGRVKGQFNLCLYGHNKGRSVGIKHSLEETSRIDQLGYVVIWQRKSPQQQPRLVREHIRIAEKALGKPLPSDAHVHHVNEDRADNSPGNLVICENASYHALLHQRRAALLACGNPNWRKCYCCQQWDDPSTMKKPLGQHYTSMHIVCHRNHERERYQRKSQQKMTARAA